MMRVVVLALILLAAAATSAAAIDLRIAAAGRQGVPSDRRVTPAEAQASGGVPALAQPALRGGAVGGPGQAAGGLAGLQPERRRQPASLLPWRGQGRSALALPLTDRLALGIGYRRVLGEDLWLEFAEIGAMDYESHNVLLRAHWRF
jgi:hypothetical protein